MQEQGFHRRHINQEKKAQKFKVKHFLSTCIRVYIFGVTSDTYRSETRTTFLVFGYQGKKHAAAMLTYRPHKPVDPIDRVLQARLWLKRGLFYQRLRR